MGSQGRLTLCVELIAMVTVILEKKAKIRATWIRHIMGLRAHPHGSGEAVRPRAKAATVGWGQGCRMKAWRVRVWETPGGGERRGRARRASWPDLAKPAGSEMRGIPVRCGSGAHVWMARDGGDSGQTASSLPSPER